MTESPHAIASRTAEPCATYCFYDEQYGGNQPTSLSIISCFREQMFDNSPNFFFIFFRNFFFSSRYLPPTERDITWNMIKKFLLLSCFSPVCPSASFPVYPGARCSLFHLKSLLTQREISLKSWTNEFVNQPFIESSKEKKQIRVLHLARDSKLLQFRPT